GANCIRENATSSERASAFASIVFPTPGKSSRIMCPSLIRQRTQRRSVSSGACTTRARLSTSRRTVSAAAVLASACSGSLTQQLLGGIYDRRGNSVFRRLPDASFARGRDQHDLVLVGVEADVVPGHVVVDDEIDPFAAQFLARAREALRPGLGGEADEHLTVAPALAERLQHIGRRLELEPPRAVVLRPLVGDLVGRAVVGDGGGHQDEIGVAARE